MCCSKTVTVMAAVSARRVRPPSVTMIHPAARAAAISSSLQPPSDPTRAVSCFVSAAIRSLQCTNDSPSRSENIRQLGRAPVSTSEAKEMTLATSGTTARPDCFAASIAMRRQRVTRFAASDSSRNRMSACFVITGAIRVMPSSVAFCTTRSNFSPLSSASASVSCKEDSGRAGSTSRMMWS